MGRRERGRPTAFSAEIAAAICDRIAEGRSLRAVCRDTGMPPESTVRSWAIDDREGFFAQYARARLIQAHAMFDEILEIADDGTNDTYTTEDGEGINYDVIQRSRLRVDSRKWYLSKALPKVYGDQVLHEHAGPDGGPIRVAVERRVIPAAANRITQHVTGNGANGKP